jgi:hypothetical protein
MGGEDRRWKPIWKDKWLPMFEGWEAKLEGLVAYLERWVARLEKREAIVEGLVASRRDVWLS